MSPSLPGAFEGLIEKVALLISSLEIGFVSFEFIREETLGTIPSVIT